MKKNLLNWMTILMVAIASVGFVSCGDDDDDSKGTSSNIEGILMQNGWQSVANYDFGTWGDNNLSLSKDQVWIYFLGNNVALGKWYYHEDDSYFGSSTSIKPLEIKYSVDGSKVTIDGTTYKYKNEALYNLNGDLAFTKTTKDYDWIEKYKYYVMSDEDRLNFNYSTAFEKFGAPIKDGSKRICCGFLYFGVNGNQKPYSRQVTSMRAEYYINGGKFSGKYGDVSTLKDNIYISKDEDCSSTLTVVFETTQSVVTIDASYYMYDSKNKKEVFIGKQTFTIDTNEWINETNGGVDGNNDGNVDGDDDDGDNQSRVFKTCPDSNHPHMIDLGLPSGTLWACCNVGAKNPEEYGDYFAWGEIKTKSYYSWDDYAYYNGSTNSLVNIGSDIAGTGYDAATAKWGSPWRLPSSAQFEELLWKTSSVWTSEDGVYGRKFTGKNGGSVFLPAAGLWTYDKSYAGSKGYYMSSTHYEYETFASNVYMLIFDSGGTGVFNNLPTYGLSVRPVRQN